MKLEIRYLAPYLPYGLNIKDVKHGSVFEALHFITTPNQDFSLFKGNFDQLINDKYLKPVLFPLSSLTKEITINGKTFVPKKLILDSAKFHSEVPICVIDNDYRLWNVFEYELLLSLKFDIYNLIEKGLAEPVTEELNPYK